MLRQRLSSQYPKSSSADSSRDEQISASESKSSRMTGFRPKRLIGRIVPWILLTFVYHAYGIVVVEFGYKHRLQSQNLIYSTLGYLFIAHFLFFISLFNYFQIFFASHGPSRIGSQIPTAPLDPPAFLLQGPVLFQCGSDGAPIRCYRDSCNGRWKPPRARHCGDCRECVPSLDHHCPWFDANICASSTMRPFVMFLSLVVILYLWSFVPLLPTAWNHTYAIWKFGKESTKVGEIWWNRRLTWLGGPFFRWIVGWIIAGNLIPKQETDTSRSTIISSPNLRPPIVVFTGLLLILVAGGLLVVTLIQIKNGDLSVDVERKKTFRRILADNPRVAKSLSNSSFTSTTSTIAVSDGTTALSSKEVEIRKRLLDLSSVLYFRVNLKGKSVVVSTSEEDRPYDLGWKNNFQIFLGLSHSRASFPTISTETCSYDTHLYWPINPRIESRLREQAEEKIRQEVDE